MPKSAAATELPTSIRIGHLTVQLVIDDALVAEHSVRERADFAGWSSASLQLIALTSKATRTGDRPIGPDYQRETLLHEVLHLCLRVAGVDPDQDAKANVEDVEERAVNSMAGPLLDTLRRNPGLLAYLTAETG